MILIRDVFRLKFGKAKEAKVLVAEGVKLARKYGYRFDRQLMDLTGPFYTLVLESSYDGLGAYEEAMTNTQGHEDWANWYEKFKPLVESGYREMFTIVEP